MYPSINLYVPVRAYVFRNYLPNIGISGMIRADAGANHTFALKHPVTQNELGKAMGNRKTDISENESHGQDEGEHTLADMLNEYKLISMNLFKMADIVAKDEDESASIAAQQAQLLDRQQALLIEAGSIKIQNGKDVFVLLELWKADEIYNNKATPSQGVVLHVLEHLEREAA